MKGVEMTGSSDAIPAGSQRRVARAADPAVRQPEHGLAQRPLAVEFGRTVASEIVRYFTQHKDMLANLI
jgi:hypothetical protein